MLAAVTAFGICDYIRKLCENTARTEDTDSTRCSSLLA